jgi:hypothetical protein
MRRLHWKPGFALLGFALGVGCSQRIWTAADSSASDADTTSTSGDTTSTSGDATPCVLDESLLDSCVLKGD